MKKIIIELLKIVITDNGSFKFSKKVVRNEKELLSLSNKELMNAYNAVMVAENIGKFESTIKTVGVDVTEDYFRNYMLDMIYEQKDNEDVVYCPDIEDEIYLTDDFINESDSRVMIIYNHNMFDLEYIKRC